MMRTIRETAVVGAVALVMVLGAGCEDGDPTGPSLAAPGAVTATALSPTSVQVTWGAVAGADGYLVQRAEGTAGAFQSVARPAGTSYEDTGLQPNTTYRYRVAAVVGSRTGPFGGEASVTTSQAGSNERVIASDIISDRTLFADTVYTLKGFIHVANGATLTIQPGTVIRGDYETLGSSLIVLRGARIVAKGTKDAPIVFTSSRPPGERRPGDWGGLVLVGNGVINRTGRIILEGTGTDPVGNPEVEYSGGTDNTDSSGELSYVRVEFAGFAPQQDAELNSFTFAAVGSGTKLEYLQSLAGLDDSFEWFGGAVDAKYLVSYESGDDHFDASEGYRGRVQYMIGFQSKILSPRPGAGGVSSDPRGIENDGCGGGTSCPAGHDSQPYNTPVFANFTLVGTAATNENGVVLRRGTGGFYVNGVVARWPKAALSLRDASTQARLGTGDMAVQNILAAEVASLFEAGSGRFEVDAQANALELAAGGAASLFTLLPTDPSGPGQFDWTPPAGSPAAGGGLNTFSGVLAARAGSFVTPTSYRGAAAPGGPKWWEGWTNYADE